MKLALLSWCTSYVHLPQYESETCDSKWFGFMHFSKRRYTENALRVQPKNCLPKITVILF